MYGVSKLLKVNRIPPLTSDKKLHPHLPNESGDCIGRNHVCEGARPHLLQKIIDQFCIYVNATIIQERKLLIRTFWVRGWDNYSREEIW